MILSKSMNKMTIKTKDYRSYNKVILKLSCKGIFAYLFSLISFLKKAPSVFICIESI